MKMFNSFINNIPLVKEVLNVIFNQSLGFNIDLEEISCDKGIKLYFNNIDLQPNKLNQLIFNGDNSIGLRITKISLKSFSLFFSMNESSINVNGINIVIMPINQHNNQQSQPMPISKNSALDNIEQSSESKPNSPKQKSIINNILIYILSRIEIKIENISLHLLNYETTKNNILYANPFFSFKIKLINYTKGVCDIEKETPTVFGNKMLEIGNVEILVENNYKEKLDCDLSSPNVKDNAVIFTIENNKGIKVYSNYNNDIIIELGITQVLINPLQVELIRNIVMIYTDLLQPPPLKECDKDKETFTNSDLFSYDNCTIKLKCESISLILLENSYRSDLPKYYCFKSYYKDLSDHFCYFEDNFFLVSLCDLNFSKHQNNCIISMSSFIVLFTEYDSKTLNPYNQILYKERKDATINKCDNIYASVYEDANTSINTKDNDSYHSVYESANLCSEREIKNYTFKYINYVILDINNIKCQINQKVIKSCIHSIHIIIHPIYMFKFLKIVYSNAIILNEILLFNYNQNLNQMVNEDLQEDNQEIKILNVNDEIYSKNNNNANPANNFISKDNKTFELKNNMQYNIKININEVKINILAFKREKDFKTIATPYFAEFYYASIYLMHMKYNSKKCLDISLITSENILSLEFKNIVFDLNNKTEINLQIELFDIAFKTKILLHLSNPCNLTYSNKMINIDNSFHSKDLLSNIKENTIAHIIEIKTSLICTLLVWQLKDMITFIDVWTVTTFIFKIFKKQMKNNHDRILADIDSKYTISKNRINAQNKLKTLTSNDDIPIFMIVNILFLSLNVKTYYDTDSLIMSVDNFQMTTYLSNNNIEFDISLNQIKSRKLFLSDQISFHFNLIQLKPIKNKITLKEQAIKPEEDFEYFISKSKSLLKQQDDIPNNQIIHLRLTTNSINIQPFNLFSLFVAIIPQIQKTKKNKQNNLDSLYNVDCNINDSIDELCSSNLMNKSPNNNEIHFKINIKTITFDYTRSQISLIVSLKELLLSPTSASLNEFQFDLRREISPNSKQSLMTTLASICGVKFTKEENGNINLSTGRIDIKVCKDSLLCSIDIISEIATNILMKVNDITELFFASVDTDDNQNTNSNMFNNSTISLNSNFIPIIQFNVEENYVTKVQSSKYFNLQPREDDIEKDQKGKNCKIIKLTLSDVFVTLFQGKDLESQIDYNATQVDYICSEINKDEFILVQSNQFAIKSQRNVTDYLMLSLLNLELNSEIELKTQDSIFITFIIQNIEIFDNLSSSNYKRMLAKKDIESIENMIKVSIQINNSLNSLSVSYYCDYEIIAKCSILPLCVFLDQSTLSFVLSFFTSKEASSTLVTINTIIQEETNENLNPNEDKEPFIIQPPHEIRETFVHLSHHSKTKKEKHIFIRSFILDEINIDISFNYLTFSTNSNNITIPLLGVEQFPFVIKYIKLKGYYQLSELVSILSDNLFDQLLNSKFNLLYKGMKTFNLTKPLTNLVEKFIQLFTTPYYSYKDNKGLFKGFVIGVKNFIINIVSLNFLYGEKTVKTLTALIGVSKSNQITKQSFYNKYILDEQQQKVNEYFYKG